MKKLISLVVVLAIAAAGYYYWDSQKAPQVPELSKVVISQGNVVEAVSATGTLQADRLVSVGSKVSGVIDELNTDFNQIVRRGRRLRCPTLDRSMRQPEEDLPEQPSANRECQCRQPVSLIVRRQELAPNSALHIVARLLPTLSPQRK